MLKRIISLKFSPYALLLLTGYLLSELVTSLGFDIGLRWFHFRIIGFYGILPLILFSAIISFKSEDILPRRTLHIFLLVLSFFVILTLTTVLLFYFINNSAGFPWITALLTAVILGATDPALVLNKIPENFPAKNLIALLKSEGLLNLIFGISIFGLLIPISTHLKDSQNIYNILTHMLALIGSSILWGIFVGSIFLLFGRYLKNKFLLAGISIVLVYAHYIFVQEYFHIPGIISLVTVGFIWRKSIQNMPEKGQEIVLGLWRKFSSTATYLIFFITGVSVYWAMFSQRWLAIIGGVLIVLIARAISGWPMLKILKIKGIDSGKNSLVRFIAWGSSRGAITLSMAISVPLEVEGWFTVQSIVYGVVLFMLFIVPLISFLPARK
jgi:Na+:H+ antiporter